MGRAPCCDKNGLKKGPWTPEEDHKLIDYIQKHGYGNWRTLPKNAGLQRCGKSCRLRWTNYLRPDIKRGRFSLEEEEAIIQLHRILGNKWSAIASRLPGRTDNEIKNYWNTHIRKRLLRMGIDPVTHSPRLDLLDLSSILTSSLYASSSILNGIQPLHLNPELLKLAYSSSLIPPISQQQQQQQENFSFCPQNYGQENQIPYHDDTFFQAQEMASASTLVDPNPSNFPNYVPDDDLPSYGYNYGHQNSLVEPPLLMYETSNVFPYSNNSNHNFSFESVLSTPSSSPTPLNSNYSTCTDQDERDTYGGSSSSINNMLKFEIPDVLDVNEFHVSN